MSDRVDLAVEVLSQETEVSIEAMSDKTMLFKGGNGDSVYQPKFLTVVLASQLLL